MVQYLRASTGGGLKGGKATGGLLSLVGSVHDILHFSRPIDTSNHQVGGRFGEL
jgi:hypothetical protein